MGEDFVKEYLNNSNRVWLTSKMDGSVLVLWIYIYMYIYIMYVYICTATYICIYMYCYIYACIVKILKALFVGYKVIYIKPRKSTNIHKIKNLLSLLIFWQLSWPFLFLCAAQAGLQFSSLPSECYSYRYVSPCLARYDIIDKTSVKTVS